VDAGFVSAADRRGPWGLAESARRPFGFVLPLHIRRTCQCRSLQMERLPADSARIQYSRAAFLYARQHLFFFDKKNFTLVNGYGTIGAARRITTTAQGFPSRWRASYPVARPPIPGRRTYTRGQKGTLSIYSYVDIKPGNRTVDEDAATVPLIYFLSFLLRKSLIYFQYVIPLTLVIICNLLNSMFHFLSLPETPGSELVGIPTGIGYRKTRSKYTASTIGGARGGRTTA
jgi:hypothetical protein